MMIQKLIEELYSIDDDEENVWLKLSSAEWLGADLQLFFVVKDLSKQAIMSQWLVRCIDVISYLISDASGGGLNYHEDDHPAIAQFTDAKTELYFNGKSQSVSNLIIDLWEAHRKISDDWIPFETYLNNNIKFRELISSGYGLLASGPKFLIDEYEIVLRNHSVNSSRINHRYEPIHRPVAMIHFGESFVIAKKFAAQKLENR